MFLMSPWLPNVGLMPLKKEKENLNSLAIFLPSLNPHHFPIVIPQV
jgi:hypothetical protein